MRWRQLPLLAVLAGFPVAAMATNGTCADDDTLAVSIMADSRGRLLDLVATEGDRYIARFPEASGTQLTLPSLTYTFRAKKTKLHEALDLDISYKQGQARFRGKLRTLTCEWR